MWPVAACLMYAPVVFNSRYLVGYFVLLCLGAAALVLQPFRAATRAKVMFAAALLLALVGVVRLRPTLQAALHPNNEDMSLTRAGARTMCTPARRRRGDWPGWGSGPEMRSASWGTASTVTTPAWPERP